MKTTPLPEILKQITPLPLKVDRAGVNIIDPREKAEYVLAYCKGGTLAEVQSNAAYLTHAANVLPGLVEALRGVPELLESLAESLAQDAEDSGAEAQAANLARMAELIRQALSLATNVPVNS